MRVAGEFSPRRGVAVGVIPPVTKTSLTSCRCPAGRGTLKLTNFMPLLHDAATVTFFPPNFHESVILA